MPRFFMLTLIALLFAGSVTDSKSQGNASIDSSSLVKLIKFSEQTQTDEFIILHRNRLVCHWKNDKCDSLYFNTASMVKSWTGLVVGKLIEDGLIASEDDLVCAYMPEWSEGCRHEVTMKNLLTMTAGYYTRRGAQGILAQKDMNAYVLNLPLDTVPNAVFKYSNESVQLLGILIEKVTGNPANDYFQEKLFVPLGMDSTRLGKDPSGNDVVYGGAMTTIDDAVKVGMLIINDGVYEGRQVIPSGWIKKCITPHGLAPFYGYLWWIDNHSEDRSYAAMGDGGKLTIIFPDKDLVFLRQQSCDLGVGGNMPWMGPNYLKMIASVVKEE